MPRQAHGRPVLEAGPPKARKRKPTPGKGLHALETAEQQFPEKIKIRQHRLGEAEDDDDETPQSRNDVDGRSAKRRKIENNINEAGSEDGGSDPDGNEWHVGMDEDDEDSDIDSDDAFGASDEERFADFTFRGSEKPRDQVSQRKKKSKVSRLDLDENDEGGPEAAEEEESDDDLGEDAVDLATAWDMDDVDLQEEKARQDKKHLKTSKKPPLKYDSSEISLGSAGEETGSEEEDEEEPFEEFSADDADDKDANARLRSFVDSLTPAEKAAAKSKESTARRNLPDKPSQFALPASGLTAADLMQYVKDPTQRQTLKMLQSADRDEGATRKGGIPGKLAVPLAKRQQDRLDRVAAYDESKKTVDRWVDTVKQNRRADHVSFPLLDPTKASASSVKTFQPVSKSEPQNALESKIQEIMKESGLAPAQGSNEEVNEQKFEELKMKDVSLDEVQARRAELRMQRELMFREEVRSKRIKKIKSKAYRRVHRKERDKLAVKQRERLTAAGVLNSDEEREENDRRRAEERMGARHRESKWAKAAKASGQTTWNEDAKAGVSELARRDEELRRRVEGKSIRNSDESGTDSESEYSESDDDGFRLKAKIDKLGDVIQPTSKSKLGNMAFMQRAEAARKAENDEELHQLKRSLNDDGDEVSEDASDVDDLATRQHFGKSSKQPLSMAKSIQRNEFEARLSEDEAETLPVSPIDESANQTQSTFQPLKSTAGSGKALVQTDANPVKSAATNEVVHYSKTNTNARTVKSKGRSAAQSDLHDYTSPSESEVDLDNGLDVKDRQALDIFAGDDEADLRKQFQKEKKKAAKEEGDQVIDNSLPGWGSWAGAGISKREQKKAKGRNITTIKGIAPEQRKDAKLDRVIVNEKRIKKNDKYLATELPHPFESRQQYERSMRLPMGPEWSTRNHYQDAIKPRVLLKQGHVIKPMVRPTA